MTDNYSNIVICHQRVATWDKKSVCFVMKLNHDTSLDFSFIYFKYMIGCKQPRLTFNQLIKGLCYMYMYVC